MSSGLIVAIAAIVGILFAVAAALGSYAVYRVNKQSTALDMYKANADNAEQSARLWQSRAEATQAELDVAVRDLGEAQQQISDLRIQVVHLEGIVTARAEISQLVSIVSQLAETVKDDHAAQRQDHQTILAVVGGK